MAEDNQQTQPMQPVLLSQVDPLQTLRQENQEPNVVIITGMSGAGRTEAVHTFEDLGYFCIDNLPPELIMSIVSLASTPGQNEGLRKLAIACPIRTEHYYDQLVQELANLDAAGLTYRIVFLDCKDETLIARYKASRRLHPLSMDNHLTIAQAIQRERGLVKDLKKLAHSYIDTSEISTKVLRERLRELYSNETEQEGMGVIVYSFGFKHGAPNDADIVIDVRFLPNPFYIPEMRPLTGLDEPVRDFVMCNTETEKFLDAWERLLDTVMPGYVAEGKHHVAIGVGCTGGQHRSVVLAEQTANYLKSEGYNVNVFHRDIALADTSDASSKTDAASSLDAQAKTGKHAKVGDADASSPSAKGATGAGAKGTGAKGAHAKSEEAAN